MKKSIIFAALATAGMAAAPSAQAALAADASLLMGPQTLACVYGGTAPDACVAGVTAPDGNYFAMDNDGSGIHELTERVALSPGTDGGITLGSAQGAGAIDAVWGFFGGDGNHTQTSIGISAGDDGTGDGIASLDMSSLIVDWNNNIIPMGGSTTFLPADSGIATVTCGVDCGTGDSFVLNYEAHVPVGFGFDNVFYTLHLEGTIGAPSAIPVPAAVWLFGSGLLGLVGVARRRTAA